MIGDIELSGTDAGLDGQQVSLHAACDGGWWIAARPHQMKAGESLLVQSTAFGHQALLQVPQHIQLAANGSGIVMAAVLVHNP